MLKGTLDFFNLIYPIGSIYMSVNSTNPHDLFGGTWQQIKGRFLLGTGTPTANTDNYFGKMSGIAWNAGVNSQGGQDYHTLVVDEMPSHNHNKVETEGPHMYPNWGGSSCWGSQALLMSGNAGDSTQYVGGGQKHNNMPPYLAVYIWKRTA